MQTTGAPSRPDSTAGGTVDRAEVEKFDRLAAEWWNPAGKFRPLHKFNPVRLAYLRDMLCRHFDRDPRSERPLAGLAILDIGCGGGLLSEPLARMGADVVGADAAPTNIEVARLHATRSGSRWTTAPRPPKRLRRPAKRSTRSSPWRSSSTFRTSMRSSGPAPAWCGPAG